MTDWTFGTKSETKCTRCGELMLHNGVPNMILCCTVECPNGQLARSLMNHNALKEAHDQLEDIKRTAQAAADDLRRWADALEGWAKL